MAGPLDDLLAMLGGPEAVRATLPQPAAPNALTQLGQMISGMPSAWSEVQAADERTRALIGQGRYADATLQGLDNPMLQAFGAGAIGRVPPIRAYHGSPHSFDKFDLSKIGTGEGAQAYGHGLYFAEAEDVARSYRDQLAGYDFARTASGAPVSSDVSRMLQEGYEAAASQGIRGPSFNDAVFMAQQNLQRQNADALKAGDMDWYKKIAGQSAELHRISKDVPARSGKMYEVGIHADPRSLLDWDKPLSAQSEAVRKALQPLYGDVTTRRIGDNPNLGTLYDLMVNRQSVGAFPEDALRNKSLIDLAMAHDPRTGQAIYNNPIQYYSTRADANSPWQPSGVSTYQDALAQVGGDKSRVLRINDRDPVVMSERLREAGIPGIRYLDQGSRGTGTGTSNYAIWNDQLIEILRKYGILPPLAAGGAALGMGQPQEPVY